MHHRWRKISPGICSSIERKWLIKLDYNRNTVHSDYRNWRVYDVSKDFDIRIKADFKSLKIAKEYADTH